MTSCRLPFNFSTNIIGEAAGDINLQTIPVFIVSSRYNFSTLSSVRDIEYSFLNEGCCLSFKSLA